jgi:hypothetical protein
VKPVSQTQLGNPVPSCAKVASLEKHSFFFSVPYCKSFILINLLRNPNKTVLLDSIETKITYYLG